MDSRSAGLDQEAKQERGQHRMGVRQIRNPHQHEQREKCPLDLGLDDTRPIPREERTQLDEMPLEASGWQQTAVLDVQPR